MKRFVMPWMLLVGATATGCGLSDATRTTGGTGGTTGSAMGGAPSTESSGHPSGGANPGTGGSGGQGGTSAGGAPAVGGGGAGGSGGLGGSGGAPSGSGGGMTPVTTGASPTCSNACDVCETCVGSVCTTVLAQTTTAQCDADHGDCGGRCVCDGHGGGQTNCLRAPGAGCEGDGDCASGACRGACQSNGDSCSHNNECPGTHNDCVNRTCLP